MTTNGPVPIGPKLASVHSGARAPKQSANCAAWITGDWPPTNGPYGFGFAVEKVTFVVCASIASTLSTPSNLANCAQPPSGFMQYCAVNTRSAEVTGVPSDHSRPSFSFQVMDVRSSDTPPFATVGISSVRYGTKEPFWSKRAIGSMTTAEDSISFVPPDKYGFKIEGACQ